MPYGYGPQPKTPVWAGLLEGLANAGAAIAQAQGRRRDRKDQEAQTAAQQQRQEFLQQQALTRQDRDTQAQTVEQGIRYDPTNARGYLDRAAAIRSGAFQMGDQDQPATSASPDQLTAAQGLPFVGPMIRQMQGPGGMLNPHTTDPTGQPLAPGGALRTPQTGTSLFSGIKPGPSPEDLANKKAEQSQRALGMRQLILNFHQTHPENKLDTFGLLNKIDHGQEIDWARDIAPNLGRPANIIKQENDLKLKEATEGARRKLADMADAAKTGNKLADAWVKAYQFQRTNTDASEADARAAADETVQRLRSQIGTPSAAPQPAAMPTQQAAATPATYPGLDDPDAQAPDAGNETITGSAAEPSELPPDGGAPLAAYAPGADGPGPRSIGQSKIGQKDAQAALTLGKQKRMEALSGLEAEKMKAQIRHFTNADKVAAWNMRLKSRGADQRDRALSLTEIRNGLMADRNEISRMAQASRLPADVKADVQAHQAELEQLLKQAGKAGLASTAAATGTLTGEKDPEAAKTWGDQAAELSRQAQAVKEQIRAATQAGGNRASVTVTPAKSAPKPVSRGAFINALRSTPRGDGKPWTEAQLEAAASLARQRGQVYDR